MDKNDTAIIGWVAVKVNGTEYADLSLYDPGQSKQPDAVIQEITTRYLAETGNTSELSILRQEDSDLGFVFAGETLLGWVDYSSRTLLALVVLPVSVDAASEAQPGTIVDVTYKTPDGKTHSGKELIVEVIAKL